MTGLAPAPVRGLTTVDAFYQVACQQASATGPHLPRLRALAEGCDLAIEFGVKKARSSAALLMGASRVISCDLIETREARLLAQIAGPRWDYRIESSITADLPPCDLLFVDSLHTYAQVKACFTTSRRSGKSGHGAKAASRSGPTKSASPCRSTAWGFGRRLTS